LRDKLAVPDETGASLPELVADIVIEGLLAIRVGDADQLAGTIVGIGQRVAGLVGNTQQPASVDVLLFE
jgi:hypothetical protein